MFLRLLAESFTRRPKRKLLTMAALALGMAVATAALSVSLDVGDRLSQEFRSLGANLLVTPQTDSLPLEISGVDYRPVNAGAYLPESDLPKHKSIFWRNNILCFAPILEVKVSSSTPRWSPASATFVRPAADGDAVLIGTWSNHPVALPEGGKFITGLQQTNPWWRVEGSWFQDGTGECIVGKAFADRNSVAIGSPLYLATTSSDGLALKVTGIFTSGSSEDNAVVTSISIVQQYIGKPGQYRKLYVSALTKPEDAFAKRDRNTFSPKEYDTWFCTPYISSIAFQIQQELPGTDVRVIRRVAEGEGQILTRVRMLLWLVTGEE